MTTPQASPEDVFGPVIYAYSRAQAIDDGVLVDVSETAGEAGIRFPVALTRAVYEQCVIVPPHARCQDERGRLWDVLGMTRYAIMRAPAGRTELAVSLVCLTDRGKRRVTLKAICGPGDDAEPVITVMLPEED